MNFARAMLLGSAAGLCAVTGAQAADLPTAKAAPVEYVRVCNAYGPGFFYIPGSDTCIKIGGRARFEYQLTGGLKNGAGTNDRSSFRGLGRISVDARTASEWGAVRTFVSFEIASRTGGWPLRSNTAERGAAAFFATGIDTYGRAQKYVEVDKAFIQFGGLTAGRFSSFYDFYGHTLELIGASASSEVPSTNGIAYTAKLGNGFSATISVEDPTFRRTPIFNVGGGYAGSSTSFPSALTNIPYVGTVFTSSVGAGFNPVTGLPVSYSRVDIAQRENVPDFVGVLRYDGGWGSAQLSGALHQISVGGFQNMTGTVPAATLAATGTAPIRPSAQYGYAVQGGVKINLPMIAPGDQLWLQAAYGRGAMSYTGISALCGGYSPTCQSFGNFTMNTTEAYVNAYGDLKLSTSWSFLASFLHYWTPTVRQSVFASYAGVQYGAGARSVTGPLYAGLGGSLVPTNGNFTTAQANAYAINQQLRDFNVLYVGTNLVWSPIKNLDIGAEVSYAQVNPDGRVANLNKPVPIVVNGVSYTRTTSSDSVWQGRIRIQRDF